MAILIDLPKPIEDKLSALGDVSRVGREAMLVELYRQGVLSHGELAQALATSRTEVDAILQRHNVVDDLLTPDELAQQVAGLESRIR